MMQATSKRVVRQRLIALVVAILIIFFLLSPQLSSYNPYAASSLETIFPTAAKEIVPSVTWMTVPTHTVRPAVAHDSLKDLTPSEHEFDYLKPGLDSDDKSSSSVTASEYNYLDKSGPSVSTISRHSTAHAAVAATSAAHFSAQASKLAAPAGFAAEATQSRPPPPAAKPTTSSKTPTLDTTYCDGFASELSDIVIVVKTGATEAFSKLPTQLLTFLQCAGDNLLLFSDMDQWIGTHHILDSLDTVSEAAKKDNPDFDLYRLQQEYRASGQDMRTLSSEKGKDAWNLDKYKNVHIARKTYVIHPDKKWYVFIDADTYVVWPSLVEFLSRENPNQELFFGSPAYINDIAFAHGGSGYVLSAAQMKKLVGSKEDFEAKAETYDLTAKNECCGDLVLALAVYATETNLTNVWPTINGEKPRTLPFGPSHWCQPVITMHHLSPEEVSDVWRFEQTRENRSQPLLLADIFHAFMSPSLTTERADWDNFSNDLIYRSPDVKPREHQKDWWELTELEKAAYKSFDDCKAACVESEHCFQFVYTEGQGNERDKGGRTGECGVARAFKWGEAAKSKKDQGGEGHERTFRSGWLTDRIQSFGNYMGPCDEPQWVQELVI